MIESVAYVSPANGAYLIQLAGEQTVDSTSHELWDAASSLRTAKRIARTGAEQLGYRPPFRWSLLAGGPTWVLEATSPDDEGNPDG